MLPVQLPEWNRTEVDYQRSSTIADLFREQAALTPDAIAVVANDRQLSYREVNERSNQLALHLQSLGVRPETLVGLFLRRSENLVIGILAILKAGGAYVPLDPSYPEERISTVIDDSGMRILLTSAETRERLPLSLNHIAVLDIDDPELTRQSAHAVTSTVAADNLAYVIYTSGSTGKPKGVMIEHRNVVNFFTGMDRAIGSEPGVWLAVTSIAFDISVLELLWTLTRGFKLVIHCGESRDTIADEITRHRITHLQMTPSLARMLTLDSRAYSALAGLKQILLGGEALPASLIHRLRDVFSGELYNMYGPTETTIWSTTYLVTEVANPVPIGHPIANTQIYLLDADMQPVPTGETGDLFICGDGVARGYWNRPDLTAERFLNLPAVSSNRLYRTGDLARILPDGDVEFLGRADDQIKLRGHRIELGEIEAILERCPGVKQAVIAAREDREGDKRLIAYLVAESAGPEAALVLKTALSAKLPEPMIPSSFVFLSALPLTDNGKINRKELLNLPPPVIAVTSSLSPIQTDSGNEVERIVAKAWQEALGVAEVGLNDNFFDLGAHSLTVAEVQSKLQSALRREISIVDLFQFSTVSSLSRHLAGTQSLAATTSISDRAQRRRLARQP
jgi:amino acid adenylation domain-containing protein